MASADVGDDVYGEDPTVRKLEEATAELLGREAALFVPTGSMGNQICARLLASSGTEVIVESRAHIYNAEMAALAALSGLLPRPIPTPDGILTPALVGPAIQDSSLRPRTSLICLENTGNFWGGKLLPRQAQAALVALARLRGPAVHLDGSRIWNAAAAFGIPEKDVAEGADTVNVCFSKGLGAPVGSAIAGSRGFIEEGRRARKLFGGGMRQAGVLAAAALVSLENRERIAEDHRHARKLAEGLATIPGVELPYGVDTNIVIFRVLGLASSWIARFRERGVLAGPALAPNEVRMVTHLDVSAGQIDQAVEAAREFGKEP
ncbi:MAG: GntG family PLP-dependent aldolase [Thermoanaerobaculia bacterium]